MGKDKVEAQLKAKKIEELKKVIPAVLNTAVDLHQRTIALNNNLNKILEEEFELTYPSGNKATVKGRESDPKTGTIGTIRLFESSSFKGHPFLEVSRDMATHFRMYCLVNGVSDAEMLSMAKGEPSPGLANVLRDLKKDFFNMVAQKDMDAISDFYVGISNYVEKKLPDLMKCTDLNHVVANADNMLLIGDNTSFMQQTLRLNNDKNINADQQQLVSNVNSKLKAQGKTYTLNDVGFFLESFDFYPKSINTNDYKPRTDKPFETMISMSSDDPDAIMSLQNAFGLTQAIRDLHSEAIMSGKIISNDVIGTDTSVVIAGYRARYEDDLLENEIDNYGKGSMDQAAVSADLNKRAAKLKGGNAPRAITDLANTLSDIDKIEQKIKTDPSEVRPSDYENLRRLYNKAAVTSKNIIGSQNADEYSDAQYSLAFETKDFAAKGSQNPQFALLSKYKNDIVSFTEATKELNAQCTAIDGILVEILKEPLTHTDKNGVQRIIAGEHNRETAVNPDDPFVEQKTESYGIRDIFAEGTEFHGKPFREASRNMHSHFKMYCLSQGVPEESFVKLADSKSLDDVPKELRNTFTNMKAGFFDMIINRDMNKISDMYVRIGEILNNDRDRFMGLVPGDADSLRNNRALLFKYDNSQGWYSQTLSIGNDDEKVTPEQKALVAGINSGLAEKGLGFTLEQMRLPLAVPQVILSQLNKFKPEDLKDPARIGSGGDIERQVNWVYSDMSDMQDRYKEYRKDHPGDNWIKAFPKDTKTVIFERETKRADRNYALKSVFTKNPSYGIAPRLKDKKKNLTPEETRKMLEKTLAKSRRKLMRNLDKPDPKALVSFVAVKEFLKDPSKFAGAKILGDVEASINQNAVLEAFDSLSKEERNSLLNASSDSSEYTEFIEDYNYNVELDARKEERAAAELREENRAYAEFESRPLKDAYVEQQKELGRILNDPEKYAPDRSEKVLSSTIKENLAKMIAAKRLHNHVTQNYEHLSKKEIKNLSSSRAVEAQAALLKKNPAFDKLAKDLMSSPEDLINLSIGAEKLLDPNATVMFGTSEKSEQTLKQAADVIEFNDGMKKVKEVFDTWSKAKTQGKRNADFAVDCAKKLINISEQYNDFDYITYLCGVRGKSMFNHIYNMSDHPQDMMFDKFKLQHMIGSADLAKGRLQAQGVDFGEHTIPKNIENPSKYTKSGFEADQAKLTEEQKNVNKEQQGQALI